MKLEEGKAAPGFRLESTGGGTLSPGDLAGNWVVLFFYVRDNTSGCTNEAVEFSGLRKEFDALGAVVLGVSPDSIESHHKFRQKHGIAVDLLSDPERAMIEAYGAWGTKKLYGKEHLGVIRSSVLIDPSGTVRRMWPKAKSKGHAAEVLAALRSLLDG